MQRIRNDISIDKRFVKYFRIFFVNLDNLDELLRDLLKFDVNIVKGIFLELIDKPIFAKNIEVLNKFYKSFNIEVNKNDPRKLSENEIQKYSYLDKIEEYMAFKMNHFIIYQLMEKYEVQSLIGKLNLENMKVNELEQIFNNCKNVDIIKKVHIILMNKKSDKNPTAVDSSFIFGDNDPFARKTPLTDPSENIFKNFFGGSPFSPVYNKFIDPSD